MQIMQQSKGRKMSNARFSILQAKAVKDKNISDSQFRTLAALGMYSDQEGWCFPSLKTLGNDLGKSKQAVGRDTIALRKLGYLEVTARFDKNGSRRSCLYRLIFDLPRQPDVDTLSTQYVDTPSTPDVDVNDPPNDPPNEDNRFAKIQTALEKIGILLTSSDPMKIDVWMDKHSDEHIQKAIDITQAKGVRNIGYVNTILAGWLENDYPENRKKPTQSANFNNNMSILQSFAEKG